MPKIFVQSKEKEHAKRLEQTLHGINGIFGSEAAAACGQDKFMSKLELWARKTGRWNPETDRENERIRLGRDLGSYIAERFSSETGKRLRVPEALFVHEKYDFLIADHDREIIGEKAGLICEAANFAFEKIPENCGELPKELLAKCFHNLAVMDFEKIYLAVLDLFSGIFKIYEIYYDEKKCGEITDAEIRFWNGHVVSKIPPKPDGSDSAEEALKRLAEPVRDNMIDLGNYSKSVEELYGLRQKIKEFEGKEKRLRQELIAAMDGNSSGVTEKFRVDFSKQNRKIADLKLLKEKYSGIFNTCLRDSAALILKISEI